MGVHVKKNQPYAYGSECVWHVCVCCSAMTRINGIDRRRGGKTGGCGCVAYQCDDIDWPEVGIGCAVQK